MARTAVLGASLTIIGLLAVLTMQRGHPAGSGHPGGDLARCVLIVLGIGVVGALSTPPPDE